MAKSKRVKTRYNKTELKEFEKIINAKIEKARTELDFFLTQLKSMADNPDAKIRGLGDGTNSSENERVSILARRQEKLIHHLENAKLRMLNGVYGVCRETGKLISKERLKAVPHATLSIEAKQMK